MGDHAETGSGPDLSRLVEPASVRERFDRHVQPDEGSDCWLWTGAHDKGGYGRFWVPYADERRKGVFIQAHRVAWAIASGSWLPRDRQLDHVCRVRDCVYPLHLEVVDQVENVRRAAEAITHCPRGHAYTPANTGWQSNGAKGLTRVCRLCRKLQSDNYHLARRAERRPPKTKLAWLVYASGQSITWWAAMTDVDERSFRQFMGNPAILPSPAYRYRILRVAREIWPEITEADIVGPVDEPEPLLG
jgi:hypothetical protein